MFKKIFLGIFTLLAIFVLGLTIYLLQIDPRFSGTFRSDLKGTMAYIKSTNKYSAKQIKIFEQMFGYLTHVVDGHTIQDYPEGSSTKVKKGTNEYSYIMLKKAKDKAVIVEISSPFWDIDSIDFHEIEFDVNGYWLLSLGVREKFKKI